MIRVFLWRALALLCVALGLVGAVVPVMPTTVFMLVAAWAATRAGRAWKPGCWTTHASARRCVSGGNSAP